MGQTYYDFIEMKGVKTLDKSIIEDYASQGYNQIKAQFQNEVVIVNAQFIPDIGVLVGSKPRGQSAVSSLLKTADEKVPAWDAAVEGREHSDGNQDLENLLHAEDHTIIKGGEMYAKKMGLQKMNANVKFPKGSWAASWGKYTANDKKGNTLKAPCGANSKLSVSCMNV
jgi:hypothetical protein